MILLSLWMVGVVGVTQGVDQAQARRRVHELRGRLSIRPTPEPPSGVLRRMAWGISQVPTPQQRTLIEKAGLALYWQRHNEAPTPESRDLAIEQLLGWWTAQVKRGLRVSDIPWEAEWRRHALPTDPLQQEFHLIRTPCATQGSLAIVSKEMKDRRSPARGYMFVRFARPYTESEILSPEDTYDNDVLLYRVERGDICGTLSGHYVVNSVILPRILDWIEQTHPNLFQFTFPHAQAAAWDWHQTFSGPVLPHAPVPLQPADTIVVRFPDGAMIVSVRSKQGLEDEGNSLKHCVGGYWARVRDGQTVIWSYRTEKGVPLLTVELSPDLAFIRQVHGFEDLELSPEWVGTSASVYTQPALRVAWTWVQQWIQRWVDTNSYREGDRLDLSAFGLPSIRVVNPKLNLIRLLFVDPSWRAAWSTVVDALHRGEAETQVEAPVVQHLYRLLGRKTDPMFSVTDERSFLGEVSTYRPSFWIFVDRTTPLIRISLVVPLDIRGNEITSVEARGATLDVVLETLARSLAALDQTAVPSLSASTIRSWFETKVKAWGVPWP